MIERSDPEPQHLQQSELLNIEQITDFRKRGPFNFACVSNVHIGLFSLQLKSKDPPMPGV
jgi:hypothetical protein